jgi:uncharacterized protein YqgV (UPF0045/DUF77 family)
MMVFLVKDKGKLDELLKENAYTEDSVARMGYNVKEMDGRVYLVVEGNEEEKVMAALGNAIERVDEEERERVMAKLKEEEESAVAGFGGIFG